MPKWKKDAKEFTVGVSFHQVRGYAATIPKPVMERLARPEKVTFVIRKSRVELRASKQPIESPGDVGRMNRRNHNHGEAEHETGGK